MRRLVLAFLFAFVPIVSAQAPARRWAQSRGPPALLRAPRASLTPVPRSPGPPRAHRGGGAGQASRALDLRRRGVDRVLSGDRRRRGLPGRAAGRAARRGPSPRAG